MATLATGPRDGQHLRGQSALNSLIRKTWLKVEGVSSVVTLSAELRPWYGDPRFPASDLLLLQASPPPPLRCGRPSVAAAPPPLVTVVSPANSSRTVTDIRIA